MNLNPELKAMVEELVPFTSEFSHNLVTIMNEDDAKAHGFWSEESLLDKYHVSQGKQVIKKMVEEKVVETPKVKESLEPVVEKKQEKAPEKPMEKPVEKQAEKPAE